MALAERRHSMAVTNKTMRATLTADLHGQARVVVADEADVTEHGAVAADVARVT